MIDKVLAHMGNSNTGQKFFKWASQPMSEKMLNCAIPTIESGLATTCYVWATSKQKNIDKEQKELLQKQNILSGIAGMSIGILANKWISNKTEEVVKNLDSTKINSDTLKNVSSGLRVFAPIVITGCIMRLCIPTITSLISGKMMDKKREHKLDKRI